MDIGIIEIVELILKVIAALIIVVTGSLLIFTTLGAILVAIGSALDLKIEADEQK